jgi:hypothetical protein
MRRRDPELHKRLCEELYKLGDSNKIAAQKLDCDPCLVGHWLRKDYIPSAYYLKNFHYAGCDVLYILTGERTKHEA